MQAAVFILGASRGPDTSAGPQFVSPNAFLTPAQSSPLQLPILLPPDLLLWCSWRGVPPRSGRASCTAENCEFKAGNHLGIGFGLSELPPFSLWTAATTRHRPYLCYRGWESWSHTKGGQGEFWVFFCRFMHLLKRFQRRLPVEASRPPCWKFTFLFQGAICASYEYKKHMSQYE